MAGKQQTVNERLAEAVVKNRQLYIDGIDEDTVRYVQHNLLLYPFRSTQSNPLKLFINSPGGSVYAALGIYDLLHGSKHKVETRAVGICMSAGTLLLQAGDERIASPNTTFMIHEAHGTTGGFVTNAEASQRELRRVHDRTIDIIQERIGRKLPIKRGGTPTFFTSEQALEWNLIDRIEPNIMR